MKYAKSIGLAAVAAVALMAFVGASTASATVPCKQRKQTDVPLAAGTTRRGPPSKQP